MMYFILPHRAASSKTPEEKLQSTKERLKSKTIHWHKNEVVRYG